MVSVADFSICSTLIFFSLSFLSSAEGLSLKCIRINLSTENRSPGHSTQAEPIQHTIIGGRFSHQILFDISSQQRDLHCFGLFEFYHISICYAMHDDKECHFSYFFQPFIRASLLSHGSSLPFLIKNSKHLHLYSIFLQQNSENRFHLSGGCCIMDV